ncbi:hypothetical protein BDK51DRAFT_18512 [Blyttiomyces helicus]|uniref:Major facilitator superfamily domain-containing protein n=1 Tax=Blyttiomyces helicus TaxID=388810 RepID=A0A4P9WIK1_9FUNG|nr:hypothetical protein BDK51DRAFT_18512 [Blyttiomyces helicus]|eukprot:RKO90960.1 hypothetical protein BDK51DRAFT_18512 [Blyttiomyces helicus]
MGGAGLMLTNNVGAVVLATRGDEKSEERVEIVQSMHVEILSVAGFAGRILFGTFSDALAWRWGTSRASWLMLATGLMFAGQALAIGSKGWSDLVFVTPIVGLAYGGVQTIIPVVIRDLFGSAKFSSNWQVIRWKLGDAGTDSLVILKSAYLYLTN